MATKNKSGSFEGALERLEEIVGKLQETDLPLEARLKHFEEGVALVRECRKQLDTAAKKVEVLVKSSGAKTDARLFDEVRERLRETSSGDYTAGSEKDDT